MPRGRWGQGPIPGHHYEVPVWSTRSLGITVISRGVEVGQSCKEPADLDYAVGSYHCHCSIPWVCDSGIPARPLSVTPPPGLLLVTATRSCNRLAEAFARRMLEKKV